MWKHGEQAKTYAREKRIYGGDCIVFENPKFFLQNKPYYEVMDVIHYTNGISHYVIIDDDGDRYHATVEEVWSVKIHPNNLPMVDRDYREEVTVEAVRAPERIFDSREIRNYLEGNWRVGDLVKFREDMNYNGIDSSKLYPIMGAYKGGDGDRPYIILDEHALQKGVWAYEVEHIVLLDNGVQEVSAPAKNSAPAQAPKRVKVGEVQRNTRTERVKQEHQRAVDYDNFSIEDIESMMVVAVDTNDREWFGELGEMKKRIMDERWTAQ